VSAVRCFSGQQPSTGRLDGRDHFPWIGDQAAVIREIRRFLGTVRAEEADLERVLATVLFTDIVGSTEKAVERCSSRSRPAGALSDPLRKLDYDPLRAAHQGFPTSALRGLAGARGDLREPPAG
jgi:hypothetical protein